MLELGTKSVKEHPEYKPLMDKMVDERNTTMTKKIEGWLGEKGSKFVVVGSLHLVGDKGIVKLLEANKKYKVERPKLTAPKTEEKKKEPESAPK